MKVKVTEKQIKNNYKNIIELGYCEANSLLMSIEPTFYTSGVYGWNADIYQINYNTVIVTGYRPFGNIESGNVREYDEKAFGISRNYKLTWDEVKEQINEVLEKYISEVLKEKEEKENNEK